MLVLVIGCQDHDLCPGADGLDPLGGLNTAYWVLRVLCINTQKCAIESVISHVLFVIRVKISVGTALLTEESP